LSALKADCDRNIIQQQLADYNYGSAVATIATSSLNDRSVTALLNYDRQRLCFNFDRAEDAVVAALTIVSLLYPLSTPDPRKRPLDTYR